MCCYFLLPVVVVVAVFALLTVTQKIRRKKPKQNKKPNDHFLCQLKIAHKQEINSKDAHARAHTNNWRAKRGKISRAVFVTVFLAVCCHRAVQLTKALRTHLLYGCCMSSIAWHCVAIHKAVLPQW